MVCSKYILMSIWITENQKKYFDKPSDNISQYACNIWMTGANIDIYLFL